MAGATGATGREITLPDEHGFGFSVYWNSQHPSWATVKLYAYTIDGMERRESGRTIFRENMTLGTSARLERVHSGNHVVEATVTGSWCGRLPVRG